MKLNYSISFWILLACVFLLKLFYIGWGQLDLVPDEAHYWDWSRHLDISYYSKGPFIAYNIFVGTKLGEIIGINPPNPAFWVRFPAIVNSALLGIIAWFFANRLWKDRKTAFYSILILTAIPIYAIGSILMTIDNSLMLFWALYIYLVFLALETGKGRYWYFSGIVLGLGFLSKYTMIILIPCVLLYLLTGQQRRFWLKRKEFYFSVLIALIFFIPVILWNKQHNWIGMRHVAGQAGLAGRDLKEGFFNLQIFEFMGIQFGVVSPILFILIIFAFVKSWRLRNDYRHSFLFWTGVPLGVFYLILSLHEYCQANWPAPIYFSGALLTAVFLKDKKILKTAIGIGLFMWLLVFAVDLLPFIPTRLDPTLRLRGWKTLGKEVGKASGNFSKKENLFIFSDTYQITSELAFYTPGQPNTYCVNLGRRMNQYDLWQDFNKLIGYNAIYVKHRDQDMETEIKNAFKSYIKLPVLNIRQGEKLLHQYSIFLCTGFKGLKKKDNEITY